MIVVVVDVAAAVVVVVVLVAVELLVSNCCLAKEVLFDMFQLKIVLLLSHAMLGTAQMCLIQQLQSAED